MTSPSPATPIPLRRPRDDELLGFVRHDPERGWEALSVFGRPFGLHASRAEAEQDVAARGLARLGEPWWLWSDEHGGWIDVHLVEVTTESVVARLGKYAFDTVRFEGGELARLLSEPGEP